MLEENRRLVMGARLLGIYGQVQREGEAVHVIVKKLVNLSDILDTLTQRDERLRTRSAGGEGEGAGASSRTRQEPEFSLCRRESAKGHRGQNYEESSCARSARRGASLSAIPRQTIS